MFKGLARYLRRNTLDFRTNDGRTIGEIVIAPLDARGHNPIVVDVGARNGMTLLPLSYCSRAELIGFEPNKDEFHKLRHGNTDASAAGAHIPKFKREEYHPVAIWNSTGTRPFYLTAGPGACTMMGQPHESITRNIFLDKGDQSQSYFEAHVRVIETDQVNCDTLDAVIANRTVDLLKLDVEGGEVKCLEGGRRLLREHRALLIYSEFQTVPYYDGHALLGDQHALLNSHGYRLIDLDLGHPTYRRQRHSEVRKSADRRMLMAGDAIFSLDPDRIELSSEKRQRLAVICLAFGFVSFATSLLREAAFNTSEEISKIEQAASAAWTLQRIKRIWNSIPTRLGSRL
jgi:FkbM family methyltransferase